MAPSGTESGVAVIADDDSSPSFSRTTSSKRKRTTAASNVRSTTQPSLARTRRNHRPAGQGTPKKQGTRVVTPSQSVAAKSAAAADHGGLLPVRRAILSTPVAKVPNDEAEETTEEPHAKRRLAFGRIILETPCQKNVQDIYKMINKLTGSVGGNGSFGAIYGELTMGSMQKMVDLMKKYTEFNSSSRFIDIGSGLGKPSLHVCQDPSVEFSYGIEMEMSRWMLGMANLKATVKAASTQQASGKPIAEEEQIGYRCCFDHGNIMDGKTFDPFTHVYAFSIGFPPKLWEYLAEMFNASSANYLICYHGPSDIIESYGFDVHLIKQAPTSMHGSKEGHMGYIYKRNKMKSRTDSCDPLFQDAWTAVKGGLDSVESTIEKRVQQSCYRGRLTRSSGIKHTAMSKTEEKEKAEKEAKKNSGVRYS